MISVLKMRLVSRSGLCDRTKPTVLIGVVTQNTGYAKSPSREIEVSVYYQSGVSFTGSIQHP